MRAHRIPAAAASALAWLLAQQPWEFAVAQATASSLPTSFIDIHLVTSIASTGSIEKGYIFRVEASGSTFGGRPPKGPAWSAHSALTGGDGKQADHLAHQTTMHGGGSAHPAHRLLLPPDVDGFLCNEAKGTADYQNPAGNAASSVFDPDTLLSGYEGAYILVPRGYCTFEAKARSAQRIGAAGVIVRNTLQSRYSLIDEDADPARPAKNGGGPDWANTKWPVAQQDYECGITQTAADGVGWRAEIETALLDFRPAPYVGAANDALLTGSAADGNLCAASSAGLLDFPDRCPSRRCLLTGRNASATTLEVCCAWDSYMRMGGDGANDGDAVPQDEEEAIVIPALFVTVEHGEELYDVMEDAALQRGDMVQFVSVVPYGRWYPAGHWSSAVVWALAVVTLWLAARASAHEYRASWKKISQAMNDGVLVFQRGASNTTGRGRADTEDTVDLAEETIDFQLAAPEVEMNGAGTANGEAAVRTNGEAVVPTTVVPTNPGEGFSISDDANEDTFVESPLNASEADTSFAPPAEQREPPASPAPTPSARRDDARRLNAQSDPPAPAELTAVHGLLFVAAASCFLFVLFFFDLDRMIRILYGLGGSVAMNQIALHPLYAKVFTEKKLGGAALAQTLNKTAFANLPGCHGVRFTWIDVASSVTGYALGIAWIVVGLTRVQPMNTMYYWFIQDVIGVCFCVLILGLIHVNTIMVASILLLLVFVYDVFYVLVSPHIFGTSVMVDVAMGSSSMSLSYCAKYPLDKACKGRFAPLPQLLAFPWLNDFRGGFSMLGLGDIILPGLLVSFAARYDAATALVRKCSQASASSIGGGDTNDEFSGDGSSTRRRRISKAIFHGYFGPLTIAYGIGLMIAYLVVWTTKSGQPALLYLVPLTLGTVLALGWQRRELSELWSGPRVMNKANKMVAMAGRIPEAPSATVPNSVMV